MGWFNMGFIPIDIFGDLRFYLRASEVYFKVIGRLHFD